MKPVAKIILYLTLIVIITVCADRSIGLILHNVLKKSQNRFSELYYREINADILFIGNSRCVNAIHKHYIEENSDYVLHNLSFNGMSMNLAKVIIEDYFIRNTPPKHLFIEITNINDSDALCLSLKPYLNESLNLGNIFKNYSYNSYIFSNISHLYRYNSDFFIRSLFYLNKSDQNQNVNRVLNPELAKKLKSAGENDYKSKVNMHTAGENWQSLLSIINLCKINNVTVSLFIAPYFSNTDFTDEINLIKSNIEENVNFYDFRFFYTIRNNSRQFI